MFLESPRTLTIFRRSGTCSKKSNQNNWRVKMKTLSFVMSLISLCLTNCITSTDVKVYGWPEIKGNWNLQGVYSLRGDNDCPDHSDPYFYHPSYTSGSTTPILYCKINFQPNTYRINYPEFIVYLPNEELDGIIRYDSTHGHLWSQTWREC